MNRWTVVRTLLGVVVCLAAVGCTADDGTSSGSATSVPADQASSSVAVERVDDLPTFDTLDDLVAALGDEGFACALEYDGLEDEEKVLSLCTIEEDQAQLIIWKDPGYVGEFVASGGATELNVYGANWTIAFSDPATATAVADALGARTGP
jgi:hypothetical protein